MRYRELTEASHWLPRAGAALSAPAASIITLVEPSTSDQDLHGLLDLAAVTEADIEHIVVFDGPFERRFDIRRPDAISRIVHPAALALPGLSAAEAVERATGTVLLFLRPHWLADAAAVRALASAFERECASWSMAPVAGPDQRPLLPPPPRPELLDSHDPFDRLVLAVRRDLLRRVGLPDPHVALGPHWLWDLANRARRSGRELRFARTIARSARADPVDPQIGTVPGVIVELARSDRSERLAPDRIADRNVIETPPELWSCTNGHTRALAARRGWAAPAGPGSSPQRAAMTDRPIVVYGDHDASVSLYFDGLPAQWSTKLRFVANAQPEGDVTFLAEAAAVILARDVRHPIETGVVDLLATLAIPTYAFFDDNFTALAAEYPAFAYYSRDALKKALAACTGVIATSPELANWFREECGVPDPISWPCVVDESLIPTEGSPDCEELRIGMAGGPFRQRALAADVAPALDAIAARRPVALWVRDDVSAPTAARVVAVPFDVSFGSFVGRWRTFGIHALVHPRGDTANLRYKTPNALLVALYAGAVPVVEPEPAYEGLREDDGVMVVRDGPAGWERALTQLAEPRFRRLMYERLRAMCTARFADAAAVAALERIAASAPLVDVAELNRRRPIVAQWLASRARSSWDRDASRPAPAVAAEPMSLRLFLRHPRKMLIRLLAR